MAKKRRSDADGPADVSTPSPKRLVKLVAKDDVPVFYVNSVNFELSNWDVKMRLGQIDSGDDSALNVAEVARVFMSHAHFKAFADAMARILAKIDQPETAKKVADEKPH